MNATEIRHFAASASALCACLMLSLAADGCNSASHGRAAAPRLPGQARRITLALDGGGRPVLLSACRMRARYRTYSLGGFVSYRGRVTRPPGAPWGVKVKLKRCIPHGFSETFFEHVRGRPDGTFAGIVPKLNPNEYYVRADYEGPGGPLRSAPVFFRTQGRG